MPFIIPLIGLLAAGGFAADKVGEGVNDASNGAVKLALAALVIYVTLKRLKVV